MGLKPLLGHYKGKIAHGGCPQGCAEDAAAATNPSTDPTQARVEETGTNYPFAVQSYRLHLFPLRNQTGQLSVLIPADNHNLSCLLLLPFPQSQPLLSLAHTYTDLLPLPRLELRLTSGAFLVWFYLLFYSC